MIRNARGKRKNSFFYRSFCSFLSFIFACNFILPPNLSFAQTIFNLPTPGTMITPTSGFIPPLIKGLTISPNNPLEFKFLVDSGDADITIETPEFRSESRKLIKYFMAALTIPDENMWVNLSPYEKDRIIAAGFGQTEMGRDLLAQDYLLKQLMASLTYPEDELGKKFWDKVYAKAYQLYGKVNLPVNTFNKIWIVPDQAMVYEIGATAYVVKTHLKVMLEGDYLALKENAENKKLGMDQLNSSDKKQLNDLSSSIVKEVILPEIEKEVNEGKTFANLRQIYSSMVLATWYKKNLKTSLLGQVYVNKNKIKGVDVEDKKAKEKIYQQYLDAFKLGVYNYIKEDTDPATQKSIPRKYFSGGWAPNPDLVGDHDDVRAQTPAEVANLSAGQKQQFRGFVGPVVERGEQGKVGEVDVNLIETAGDSAKVHQLDAAIQAAENRESRIPSQSDNAALAEIATLDQLKALPNDNARRTFLTDVTHLSQVAPLFSLGHLTRKDIEGKVVVARFAFEVQLDRTHPIYSTRRVKDDARLRNVIDTIRFIMENGGRLVIIPGYNGRPPGRVVDNELSMAPVALRLTEILREEGIFNPGESIQMFTDHLVPSIDANYVPQNSFDHLAELKATAAQMPAGGILMTESTRFTPLEDQANEALARGIAGLGDIFVSDPPAQDHRRNASNLAAQYAPVSVLGFSILQEVDFFADIRQELLKPNRKPFVLLLAGSKVDTEVGITSKISVTEDLLKDMQSIDSVLVGGALAYPFILAETWQDIKEKLAAADVQQRIQQIRSTPVENFEDQLSAETKRIIAEEVRANETDQKNAKVQAWLLQEIFDRRFEDIKDLMGESYISWTDIFDQLLIVQRIFNFIERRRAQGVDFTFETNMDHVIGDKRFVNGQVPDDTVIETYPDRVGIPQGWAAGDIGPQTIARWKPIVASAGTVVMAGPLGIAESKKFQTGSFEIAAAATEADQSIGAGGDTRTMLEDAKLVNQFTHASVAGGSSLEKIDGTNITPGVKAVFEQENALTFLSNTVAPQIAAQNPLVDNASLTEVPSEESQPPVFLTDAQFTAAQTLDSRRRPTVKVALRVGDIETEGYVPAGASKGGDEAETVGVAQAIQNINNVLVPMLKQSGLNLRKHEDLVQMDRLMAQAAGENFKDLGADAVVPLSWALWKMAARLHNMELYKYMRTFEPEAVSDKKELVYFYMNVYNGGAHAVKEGEELGVDRIHFQEIMVVPVGATSYAQALEMGDKIDEALQEILAEHFADERIARADEAGFSVKGLGDTSQAIDFVFQAIERAGYKPGTDVKLALDTAASTFDRSPEKHGEYNFLGRTTADEMIEYYIELVEKYEGKILSIEDGLAENDWAGWKKLKAEMKKRGVETIGDDLFVTQMPRLNKGIAEDSASSILIKVNQNGALTGTIDVVKRAKRAGMQWVVSHRSGETPDNGIADLAEGTNALGLKTGDPQPDYDFNPGQKYAINPPEVRVRRVKYERMVAAEAAGSRRGIPPVGGAAGINSEWEQWVRNGEVERFLELWAKIQHPDAKVLKDEVIAMLQRLQQEGVTYAGEILERIQEQKTFAETLKELRKEKGLTQRELAEKIGLGDLVTTVSNWERGKNRPTPGSFKKLDEFFEGKVLNLKLLKINKRNTFGAALLKLRLSRGLTQKEVGEKIGFTGGNAGGMVAHWEEGEGSPKLGDLKKLDELFGGEVLKLLKVNERDTFQTALLKLRLSRGLSQQELGRNIGLRGRSLPSVMVSSWETGKKQPTLGNLERLDKFFGGEVLKLLKVNERDTFQTALLKLRLSRGLTQRELGEELGFEGNHARLIVYKWEKGTLPNPDNLKKLDKFFGGEVLKLLKINERDTFQTALLKLRLSRGLTHRELGEKLGFTEGGISHWEMGRNLPSPDNLKKLDEFFGGDLISKITRQQKFTDQRRARLVEIADRLESRKSLSEIHGMLIGEEKFKDVPLSYVRSDYNFQSSAFYHHRNVRVRKIQDTADSAYLAEAQEAIDTIVHEQAPQILADLEAGYGKTKAEVEALPDNKFALIGFEGDRNRLGWGLPHLRQILSNRQMLRQVRADAEFIRKNYKYVVFSGMGGSGLSVQTVQTTYGGLEGLKIFSLRTTDPAFVLNGILDQITAQEGGDVNEALKKTIVIVISKSGTTQETRSHKEYFQSLYQEYNINDQDHFMLVTDPASNSPLEREAQEKGYRLRNIQLNGGTDIGGRFTSPTTNVFLLPLALVASEKIELILERALAMNDKSNIDDDIFAQLGVYLQYMAARLGKDKVTFLVPDELRDLPMWSEQLFEESLGKGGKGVTVVYRERLNSNNLKPGEKSDRVFVRFNIGGQPTQAEFVEELQDLQNPVFDINVDSINDLGGIMLGLQRAIAVMANLWDINFVDQPGVDGYKRETNLILDQMAKEGRTRVEIPASWQSANYQQLQVYYTPFIEAGIATQAEIENEVRSLGAQMSNGAAVYAALLNIAERKGIAEPTTAGLFEVAEISSYGRMTPEFRAAMEDVRAQVFTDRLQVASKLGEGPDKNHSYQQNVADGKNMFFSTYFMPEVTTQPGAWAPYRDVEYSETALRAQTLGTVQSLVETHRKVVLIGINGSIAGTEGTIRNFFNEVDAFLATANGSKEKIAQHDQAMLSNREEVLAERTTLMQENTLFGGNWKDRPDIQNEDQARAKAREFKEKFSGLSPQAKGKVVLFVEAPWVRVVADELKGSNIAVGVQSVFFDPDQDLTERIHQAVQMGATYANIGHSMHRRGGEGLTDRQANKIMRAILDDGRLIPWYTIEESGKRDSHQEIQEAIQIGLAGITQEELLSFPMTLEPTQLIASPTGRPGERIVSVGPEDAKQRAEAVHQALATMYGSSVADRVNIGYGASVNAGNSQGIFSVPQVKNALIGSASYEADPFFQTVTNGLEGKEQANLQTESPETEPTTGSDAAVLTPVGGIDLNPKLLDLQIKRDGKGVPLPLPQQPIGTMKIEGFLPIIIKVTPVNLPLLLGAMDGKDPSTDLSFYQGSQHYLFPDDFEFLNSIVAKKKVNKSAPRKESVLF